MNRLLALKDKFINKKEDTILEVDTRDYISDIEEYRDYKVLEISVSSLVQFRSGQRVSIKVGVDEKYYSRPYTIISSSKIQNKFKILVDNDTNIVNKYLYSLNVNDEVNVSEVFGNFYYSKIRDSKNIIAIVDRDGILPIYSMIQSMIDNVLDINIKLLYTVKNKEDIILMDELLHYQDNDRLEVYFFVAKEDIKNSIKGFVTKGFISSIIDKDKVYSYFISGSEGLLKYLNKELKSLNISKKYIRYEEYLPVCNIKKIKEYKLILKINGFKYKLKCYNNKTIMEAIMDSGIDIPNKCLNGTCGFCNSELILGEVKIVNDKRDTISKKYNYIHPCCSYPLSDIEIIVR